METGKQMCGNVWEGDLFVIHSPAYAFGIDREIFLGIF